MTAVDDHALARQRARVAHDEDLWADLMPEAAELVVRSGLGSEQMLHRKMRVPMAIAGDLMVELHELGVVGPGDGAGRRAVLVVADGLADVLARIAEVAGDEAGASDEEEPPVHAIEPLVSLVKPAGMPLVVDVDDAGMDASHELAVRQPGTLVPARRHVQELVTRTRQSSARAWVRVVDEPLLIRSMAVARQAPLAGARLVIWTPRGAWRAREVAGDWLFASRAHAHVQELAEARSPEWEKASRELRALKDQLATRRWLVGIGAGVVALVELAWWAPAAFAGVLAVAVVALVIAGARGVCREPKELAWVALVALVLGWVAWWQGPDLAALVPRPPSWAWWVLAGVAVVVLGWLGRKEDQKLVEMPATMAGHKPPPITAPMVIAALCALGNSKIREPGDVRVLMDPHRAGAGVQIDLELAPGVAASWLTANREKFAAALRRNLGTVWPSVGFTHPGHASIFISDLPVNEAEQEPWPLLHSGPIDIFAPQPVFTDQLGRWVYLTLAYASWVVGAVPRMGKTFLVRELLLIYGMDPRVKVIALDGKGTGDLRPLEPFAHTHVRGARVDKPEGIDSVRAMVAWLLGEMGRRTDVLAALPAAEVPDSKITSELVDAHPELDLGPIVLGMDETQSFFSYGYRRDREHKEIREEIRDGVIELMRMGPAVGIWVILATQTVRDSTIPSEAQAIAVYRYALKMEGWEPNDKVLGTGAFRAGVDATMFGFDEKGIGWLKGEGSKPQITRTVVGLDAVQSRTLAQRCRAHRLAKNLLTGEADGAAGVIDAEVVIDIVEDVKHVLRHRQRGRAQHAELVEWLRELRPENYGDLDVEELSARLRGRGASISQVRIDGVNRKGVRLSDLRKEGDDDYA